MISLLKGYVLGADEWRCLTGWRGCHVQLESYNQSGHRHATFHAAFGPNSMQTLGQLLAAMQVNVTRRPVTL